MGRAWQDEVGGTGLGKMAGCERKDLFGLFRLLMPHRECPLK